VLGFGIVELVVVLAIVLLLFGTGSLPEIMGGFGRGLQELRRSLREPAKLEIERDDASGESEKRARDNCSASPPNNL